MTFSTVGKLNEINRRPNFMLLPLCQLVGSFQSKREVIKFYSEGHASFVGESPQI